MKRSLTSSPDRDSSKRVRLPLRVRLIGLRLIRAEDGLRVVSFPRWFAGEPIDKWVKELVDEFAATGERAVVTRYGRFVRVEREGYQESTE